MDPAMRLGMMDDDSDGPDDDPLQVAGLRAPATPFLDRSTVTAEESNNVRIFLRVRGGDYAAGCALEVMDERTVVAITRKQGATAPRDGNAQQEIPTERKVFKFDTVLGPQTTQDEVYTRTAQPAVQELLNEPWPTTVKKTDKSVSGIMILVVGATNAGKTHTVMGVEGDRGILPRALEEIFRSPGDPNVKLQMVEIYNGRLKDLLPKPAGLTVQREGAEPALRNATAATEIGITSVESGVEWISKAQGNRHTFDNGINEGSSRGF
eukprot:TRINITY_DN31413_c0_g1_i1.p1 TRINITY_DN31413_c0_g1~~TRINITY_DN31413_c0_g1_i1.p1  ORF type:complete len:266 (-),score=50.52 TRINITY_DN31413_c0_g1_i1:111-908(-)